MTERDRLTLRTLLGDYPNTLALKKGELRPADLVVDFADVKGPNRAFKDVVRDSSRSSPIALRRFDAGALFDEMTGALK